MASVPVTSTLSYDPLPPRTIRLILIHPSPDRLSQLITSVETYPLDSAPPYDAISYVWGEPSPIPSSITCNGARLPITPNLSWALHRVRTNAGPPRRVWADAICINQADIIERGAQVAFMCDIYARAENVLVCLGVAPTTSVEGEMTSLINTVTTQLLEQVPRRAWEALAALMRRPWFRRAWVIQEVGMARNAVVLYGNEQFAYRNLISTVAWASRQTPLLRYRIPLWRIHREWLDWADWGGENSCRLTFYDLLDDASLLSCRDSRDRIYAFLGHPLARAADGKRPITIPDYTRDVGELYAETTKLLLETAGPRALVGVEHTDESLEDGYPSWSIRSDFPGTMNSISFPSQDVFRAGGPLEPAYRPRVDGPNLTARGITADTILRCFRIHVYTGVWSLRFSESTGWGESYGLHAFLASLFATHTTRAGRILVSSALSSTICAGRPYSDCRSNLYGLSRLLALENVGNGKRVAQGPGREDPDAAEYPHNLALFVSGRILATTVCGRLALVPRITRPGDQVCVIRGLDVPVIIRAGKDRLVLLGESYVSGLMGGQAVQMVMRGKMEEGELTIN
ncbi:hypothetical protein OQA88_9898 [Cercophora sp. LCS_1]